MMRRGHTLNELMVAIALSTIIMAMIFEISTGMQSGVEKINRRVDQAAATRAALDLLRTDVELAGHRWGGGPIGRDGSIPGGDFCGVYGGRLPDTPEVGIRPGHQTVVLRSDRFPGRVDNFRVGQRGQVPDGRLSGLDEEVAYVFQRYDQRKNLWRLRRAYRTGDERNWQCMTLLENLVIPNDGAPFRYDVLVQRAGVRTVERRLQIDDPTMRVAAPFQGNVSNELFDVDGRAGVDLGDYETLAGGSLIAGLHIRFCAGDGRKLPRGRPYQCDPDDMDSSSPNLRLFEVGLTTKNILTWRAYIEGRQG
jgi:hypothetical protein